MKRVLTLAAAIAGLAALPAAAPAASPPQPTPICVNTHTSYGVICTYDIGPIVRDITADPVGYVCSNPAIYCGFAKS